MIFSNSFTTRFPSKTSMMSWSERSMMSFGNLGFFFLGF